MAISDGSGLILPTLILLCSAKPTINGRDLLIIAAAQKVSSVYFLLQRANYRSAAFLLSRILSLITPDIDGTREEGAVD